MDINSSLIGRFTEGDQRAFRTIFDTMYPKVYAFARGFLKNDSDSQDVAQTVFIKLWVKRESLGGVRDFDAYVFTVTKNSVLNFIASKKAFTIDITEARSISAEHSSPQEQLDAKDLRLLINLVVENMPPQRQTIYRMSREQGMSNQDIAEQLNLQKKTVENHLNLALKEIRKALPVLIFILSHWVYE